MSMPEQTTYTARWLFPVAGPPLPRGTLTIQGDRVLAVEPAGARIADADLGNVAIIPGLVNPHTHLDLSGSRGQIPPTDAEHFVDWLRGVIAFRQQRTPEQIQSDIRAGLTEALKFGTTLLGDITVAGASHALVAAAPVRAKLFWELIGTNPARFSAAYDVFLRHVGFITGDDVAPAAGDWRWAISPHAPYSVNHDLALPLIHAGNVAIHVAESPAESELLQAKQGHFVQFLKSVGAWEPDSITAQHCDFVSRPPCAPRRNLYIHANYLDDDIAVSGQDTIVYCPRTHAAFGHPRHPYSRLLARGVRVCLATDSLASNPNLDPLGEARFLHDLDPMLPGEVLLRMITLSGAEALEFADDCGSLAPGKSADLVAVPLPDRDSADPYDLLLAPDAPDDSRRTMWRGRWR